MWWKEQEKQNNKKTLNLLTLFPAKNLIIRNCFKNQKSLLLMSNFLSTFTFLYINLYNFVNL